jgi:hypothetical protein
MSRWIASLVTTVMFAAYAQMASSGVILEYTGTNFDRFAVGGSPTQPVEFTIYDGVFGTIWMTEMLAANLSAELLVFDTFSFSNGSATIDNFNATKAEFSLSTDAAGKITAWNIILRTDDNFTVTDTTRTINSGTTVADGAEQTMCGPTSTAISCAQLGDTWYAASG